MSRRESRVSIHERQNDALFEFENFKKKFLLANKHITKLNSTLSVRIEELNAQISTLYTENLRLRASEIALAAQLKREREKSRKIIAETEAAASGLTKHLGFLRQAFGITEGTSSSSSSPTPPRATQRPLPPSESSPTSPICPRIARPPTIPNIYEDDEPSLTSEEELERRKSPSPKRKSKTRRLSASRLPLPARISSPPPHLDLTIVTSSSSRKTSRRQSGLVARPASPILDVREVEEEEGIAVQDEEEEEPVIIVKREKRKVSRSKDKEKGVEVSLRKKLREEMGAEGKKLKLTDVTNSPRSRVLSPVDAVVSEIELEVAAPSTSHRQFLSSSPPRSSSKSSPINYLPTPDGSSSPPPSAEPATEPDPEPEPEPAPISGRERRVRKSVNYAEPKLNTKMRKPDPEPGTTSTTTHRKRASAAAVLTTATTTTYRAEGSSSGHDAVDADNETDGARSSLEGPSAPLRVNGRIVDPAQFPLPPSRPGSSSSFASMPAASSPSSVQLLRRKKPRSYLVQGDFDTDYSDGADGDADTDYVPSVSGSGSGRGETLWANVGQRKRSGSGSGKRVSSSGGAGRFEEDIGRRHSLAV